MNPIDQQNMRAVPPGAYRRVRRPQARFHTGLLTIPVATMVALSLMPSDVSMPGALLWPAWVLTAGLVAGPILDAVENGFESLLRAEHVLIAALVIVIFPELLQSFYVNQLEEAIVRKTFIAICVFATMLAVGSTITPWRLFRGIVELGARQYPARVIFSVTVLCWVLATFNYAFASDFSPTNMVNGLLADRWSAPWARGQMGGWEAFRDFLNNFGYILPTFTVLLALRTGWGSTMTITGLLCSALNLAFVAQSGGRRLVVYVLGAASLCWICSKRRRLRPKHWIVIGLVIMVSIVFLDMVFEARNAGAGEFSYSQYQFRNLRVDDNFRSLGEMLRVMPAEADFVGFRELWYVAVRPIPRVFWEGKPIGPGFDLGQHLGEVGIALAITIIGELYMSFGWVGIVVGGIVLGRMANSWSQLLQIGEGPVATALYGLGTMALFIGIRSLQELVLMSYPILCWYGIDVLLWKLPRRSRGLAGARLLENRA